MYQRTTTITIGNGTADGFIQRLETDMVPLVEAVSGFIAYTVVKIDNTTAVVTRLFRDEASADSEVQSTQTTTAAIVNDFQTTPTVIVDADVNIGAASVLTEEYQP